MRNLLKSFFILITALSISACAGKPEKEDIVTVTIIPQKYFADRIAGDNFRINTMVPAGSSPETYEPSASSMIALDKSKGYFRIGNIGFEINWIEKLKENHPELPIFDNSRGITILDGDDDIVEIDEEDDHVHTSECAGHGGHGHACHENGDPHIWSSPANAKKIASNMYEAFITLDPENKDTYKNNLDALTAEISETQDSISSILKDSHGATFVIYHPSLTYFAREYGLNQFAIEDNGKEPSAATLKKLIDKVRDSNAKVVFIQQEFDKKNAELIAQELNLKVVQINPLSEDWNGELIKVANAIAGND